MSDAQKTIELIFKGVDKTGAATQAAMNSLNGLATNAQGAAAKVSDLDNELDSVGKRGQGLESLKDAFQALASAVVVSAFIDANLEAEKFDKAMTSLQGSSAAAAQEFEYIKSVANTLGVELFTAADAYIQLTAATKGTAIEGQLTRDLFESISVAMGKLGRSSEETNGALLAVSQIASKGTVSLEELKAQLGERLPGAFNLAAEAMNLTTSELDKLVSSGNLTAGEFLPRFSAQLKETFGDTSYIEGYAASWARLQNSMNEAFVDIGKAGAFDVITKGLQLATTSITGAIAGFNLLGEVAGAVAGAIASGDFSLLGEAIDGAMARAAEKTRGARDALFETNQVAEDLKYSGEQAGEAVADGMQKGELSAKELAKASKEVDAALKGIGIDPKSFVDPIEQVVTAFESLASNPAASGEQLLSGLLVTLDKIKDSDALNKVFDATAQAYKEGRLSAEQYEAALGALETKQDGTWEAMTRTTTATEKQSAALQKSAQEAKKAEEAGQKLRIELEKISSDERIKTLEFKVLIDVAQIQADAQKTVAAFDSIRVGIESTGETISSLWDSLGSGKLDRLQQLSLESELDKESKRRDEALKLQKDLTKAQIGMMEAQTDAINKGDGLIKISGDGLQPHLEAFMWEILKSIQVRVNADGLKMLLGT